VTGASVAGARVSGAAETQNAVWCKELPRLVHAAPFHANYKPNNEHERRDSIFRVRRDAALTSRAAGRVAAGRVQSGGTRSGGTRPVARVPPLASRRSHPAACVPPLASRRSRPAARVPPLASRRSRPAARVPPLASRSILSCAGTRSKRAAAVRRQGGCTFFAASLSGQLK
jgi:hypothetical protein